MARVRRGVLVDERDGVDVEEGGDGGVRPDQHAALLRFRDELRARKR